MVYKESQMHTFINRACFDKVLFRLEDFNRRFMCSIFQTLITFTEQSFNISKADADLESL